MVYTASMSTLSNNNNKNNNRFLYSDFSCVRLAQTALSVNTKTDIRIAITIEIFQSLVEAVIAHYQEVAFIALACMFCIFECVWIGIQYYDRLTGVTCPLPCEIMP